MANKNTTDGAPAGLPRTITFSADDAGAGNQRTTQTHYPLRPTTSRQSKTNVISDRRPRTKNVDITEHMLSLQQVCEKPADLLAKNGPNTLTPPKKKSSFQKFLHCLMSLFNLMLIAAGILEYILLGIDFEANKVNIYMGAILIAWYQQRKSENTLAALLQMIPAKTHVIRDRKLDSIPAVNLVVGDVVYLRMGDKIPADCYVFSGSDLKVDNSSLTGESDPQERGAGNKNNSPFEATNIVFNGTLAVSGEAYAIVIRTGDSTVLGQIAGMTAGEEKMDSPLNNEIARFVRTIASFAIITAAVFFIIGMVINKDFPFAINFAIGTFVAWVPEGLPATVTMLLTIAAKRMASQNVLVKDLQAVETLGAITLLATDKTGTLTRNQMTVTNIWTNGKMFSATRGHHDVGEQITDTNTAGIKEVLYTSSLCRSVKFDRTDVPMEKRQLLGDATESGLVRFAGAKLGQEFDELLPQHPKVFEIPFNSANKWMLSVHKLAHANGALTLLIKGAPERILRLCSTILYDGQTIELTDEHRGMYNETYEYMASQGHRVLAFAQLQLDGSQFPETYQFDKKAENYPTAGYTFVGLTSLEDPPKHGVREAIGRCRSAGIQVMMVTGDHPLTAEAIGRKINLVLGETREGVARRTGRPVEEVEDDEYDAVVIHGESITSMTDEDWDAIFRKPEVIFARTSPKNKLEIVTRAQSLGHICGVTGDGVNDSPALKKANLGIAMNESGSDVSKEAASMILLDDNFASIVKGIEEGRLIFANLKKSIRYTLTHSTPEIIPQILYILVPLPAILTSIMILICAALSYAWEPAESRNGLMLLPPRKPQLRARKARQPAAQIDPATGEPIKPTRLQKLGQSAKKPFTKMFWKNMFEKEEGEILVDGDLLSWAYLEAGMISAISLIITFFVILNKHGISPRQARIMAKDQDNTWFEKDSKVYVYNGREFTGHNQFYALNEARTGVFNLFICKARLRMPFGKFMFRNKRTFYGFGAGLVLLCFVTYVPPLNTSIPLYWLIALGFGFVLLAYARPIKWNPRDRGPAHASELSGARATQRALSISLLNSRSKCPTVR
ncbi:hypothetical protein DL89DRAFT_270391 [Linderina pennispora]|uniref:Cation-transporting P-type ATPase N-terminal domain-containing protein n=1 Tax=Linderina pennispora TaxID=61395 RepID=A0A1Y1VYW4_9FUNG|nr:uncharacterized protein DL89DRAFT_270391 [Linderina pennispora]ORX66215.1 hypothetical protein DL89DRAFT_270391 [Linderina pennispora]